MRSSNPDMSGLSQLQGLYLGDQSDQHNFPSSTPNYLAQLTHDDLLALAGPPPQSLQQQQQQPLSTPDELSVSPSATSQPITFGEQPLNPHKHRETFDWDPAHAFDFDSLDNFDYGGSQGAYTPSYGSWSSSFGDEAPPSFASFDAASSQGAGSGSVFSDPSSLNDPHSAFASPPLPLSFQPDFSKYINYRAMSIDQQRQASATDLQLAAANEASTSGLHRSASPSEFIVGGMDLDDQPQLDLGGHGVHAPGRDKEHEDTLTPSRYRPGAGGRGVIGTSMGLDAAGRSTTVFSAALSESPPTSSVDLPGLLLADEPIRHSPALAPLSIPTSVGPSLNLIQPTPHTARPELRKKGKGTLEFERALGVLVNEESERANRQVSQQPPFSNNPFSVEALHQQAFSSAAASTNPSAAQLQHQYPFTYGTTPPSQPLLPLYLAAPQARVPPTRKRSKSETDIMAPATQFANLASMQANDQQQANEQHPHLPSQQQWTGANLGSRPQFPPLFDPITGNPVSFASYPHLPAIDASSSFASSGLGPYRFANLDLAGTNGQQRDLEGGKTGRTALARRQFGGAGTPGYQSGLAAPVGDEFPPIGHRRSRSHGSGHRPSKSEDVALQFGTHSSAAPTVGGHLAPQDRLSPRPSLHQSGFVPPPPNGTFGAPAPGGIYTFNPPPPHSSAGPSSSANLAAFGPQRTPYVYHSPAASPLPNQDDGGNVSEVDELSEAQILESKTTAATIEAAMRRRNPNTAARFACDLCGETFTRRYNLKGHQRAHRNEKPYACSYEGCDKAFARSHDCKRHELLHLGVRRYHCDPCARTFVRLDALQRHHRSEIGQACVQSLKDAGYVLGYETSVQAGASDL